MPTSCPYNRAKRSVYLNDLKELQPSSQFYQVYQDLGQSDGIFRFVKRVYQYNVLDTRISHFFNIEMLNRFESMFGGFLVGLLGGKPYDRKAMVLSHQTKVNLNDHHFDAFLENVRKSLKHEKIPMNTETKLIDLIEGTREDVTGRTDPNTITDLVSCEKYNDVEVVSLPRQNSNQVPKCKCIIQ